MKLIKCIKMHPFLKSTQQNLFATASNG